MHKGELKFSTFVLWLFVSVLIFAAIFMYIKFSGHEDTIIDFVPKNASFYIHADIDDYEKLAVKERLARELFKELGFSDTLTEKVLPLINNEIALAHLPLQNRETQLLFLRTRKPDELVNFFDIAQKPVRKISSRLVVVGNIGINNELKPESNDLIVRSRQIQFTGDLFYWGFVDEKKFVSSFAEKNKELKNFMQYNSEGQLVFVSQLEKDRLKFRIGKLEEIGEANGLEGISHGTDLQALKPLYNELPVNAKLSIVLDSLKSLGDYIDEEFLQGNLMDLKEKYRIDHELLGLLDAKWQLNIVPNGEKNSYVLVWQLDDREIGDQRSKIAIEVENALKNILVLTHPKVENLILPDGTSAKQLVAPMKDLVREEQIVNEQKIISFSLPEKKLALTYYINEDRLFITTSMDAAAASLNNENTIDFSRLVEESFIWSGENILFLSDQYLENLPIPIYSLDFKNLIISDVQKRYFKGFEGCFLR